MSHDISLLDKSSFDKWLLYVVYTEYFVMTVVVHIVKNVVSEARRLFFLSLFGTVIFLCSILFMYMQSVFVG